MTESAHESLQITRLGRFRLIAELGSGGMADVYLATSQGPAGFSKLLVLKRLRSHDDPEALTMFMDEARLAARLSHPNIVQTFEVCHESEYSFIVMEYLEGATLQRLRKRARLLGSPVPLKYELHVLSKSLAGLHYAHQLNDLDGRPCNVVHRDFTPQNLVITYQGECKVLDFGIAKANDSAARTEIGMYKGKVSYIAPEQLLGGVLDRRVDIFAAGVLLWEAAAGRPMWEGFSSPAIFDRVGRNALPSLAEVNPNIPEDYLAIVAKALAPDPTQRYASAAELQGAVDGFCRTHKLIATSEELASYVSQTFQQDRIRERAMIDSRLKYVQSLPAGDAIVLGMPSINADSTDSRSGRSKGSGLPPSGLGKEPVTLSDAPSVEVDLSDARAWRSNARKLILFGAGAALLVAASVLLFLLRGGHPPARSAEPLPRREAVVPLSVVPPPQPVLAQEKPPALPQRVSVRLVVLPTSAELTLDGVRLSQNPFEGKFDKDETLHVLSAEARGYIAQKFGIRFDRDGTFELALQKVTPVFSGHGHPFRSARIPPPAPVPVAPPVAAPAPTPAKAKDFEELPSRSPEKAKRELDSDDPWKK